MEYPILMMLSLILFALLMISSTVDRIRDALEQKPSGDQKE